jgi:hypothetical protein
LRDGYLRVWNTFISDCKQARKRPHFRAFHLNFLPHARDRTTKIAACPFPFCNSTRKHRTRAITDNFFLLQQKRYGYAGIQGVPFVSLPPRVQGVAATTTSSSARLQKKKT